MTKETAIKLLNTYGEAWTKRDPELITTIFTDDATYDDPHEPKNIGKNAIKNYWITKVVGEQSDIHFDLQNTWVDGETVVAEWFANFIDTNKNMRVFLKEVAIFSVRDDLFSSLREYYKSEKKSL